MGELDQPCDGRVTAVVCNAVDGADDETRDTSLGQELDLLRSVGLRPTELNLREHFGLDDGGAAVAEMVDEMEWYLEHRTPFVALRDGDVIVPEGAARRVLAAKHSDGATGQ